MKTIKTLIASAIALAIVGIYFIRHHAKATSKFDSALTFIQHELPNHKTVYRKLVNSKGDFVDFSPYDYNNLYKAIEVLDSLKRIHGLVEIVKEDSWEVKEQQLEEHIKFSLDIWEKSKFSEHVEFQDFCNYLLPYRAGVENLSNYRNQILNTFEEELRQIEKVESAEHAVEIINEAFKKKMVFDLRSHAQLESPGVINVLKQGKGSCKDITQFTVMAMRSMGLAVAIDECPIWGHRNAGHQWNTVLNNDGKWVPFSGAEKNPSEFDAINDSVKAPKIFRHTFSTQHDFGPDIEEINNIPPAFREKKRIDVTDQFGPTSEVTVKIYEPTTYNEYVYLAVFNAEKWRIVSYAKINQGTATFKKMGNNNIVYLPVYYKNGQTIPAGNPFLLTPKEQHTFNPDLAHIEEISLKQFNKFFDFKWNIGTARKGLKMELFYWDDRWVSSGVCTVKEDPIFKYKVPKGALYLITEPGWDNTWQRIFSIENNQQIWY